MKNHTGTHIPSFTAAVFVVIVVVLLTFQNLIVESNAQDPQPPVWPPSFTIKFSENSTLFITHGTTKGTYYYDLKNKRTRLDRETGKYDRYCGTVYKLTDTPCTHLILDGHRYLVFPEKQYCCMCCNSTQGCDIMKPDWLSGASFVGYQNIGDTKCEEWSKKGLQDNFYYNTADERRIPVKLDMKPNVVTLYDVDSYVEAPIDPSIFDLPSYCNPNSHCSSFSVCGMV